MKPIIGITTDLEKNEKHMLNNTYVNAVIHAGGLPILLPIGIEEDVEQFAGLIDGLLLTGGGDLDPTIFGEEPHVLLGSVEPARDAVELNLFKEVLAINKPILGVCRGLQVINIALGGNMYQDIYAQKEGDLLQHSQKALRTHGSHFVQVEKDSLLESITKTNQIKVNSFHHQAVKDIPTPLRISGVASDGVIEAIESTAHRFVLGVQWHPEALAQKSDAVSLQIFDAFIQKCAESRA